ncbi:hypothetical protein Tco_0294899 [Tanacetum coccineum]
MWSLDHLSVSVPSRGLYKTKPPSPRAIKSLIQIPHQGKETRTKNKKTVVVGENEILTREIQTHMKPWVEIIRKNAICQGGHRDHVSACICHMPYCIEISTPYNLAFFILKRMEKTRFKPKEVLPYGMLLTRSSSSTLNQPSSSHLLNDSTNENDDESSHSNPSSPPQNTSSLSNNVSRVPQNPPHRNHNLNTFLSETITLQTQQRDAHRDGLRSIVQTLKNMMGGKSK